jgi:hypothetical protein
MPVIAHSIPDSSIVSRTAAWATDSPRSIAPPGERPVAVVHAPDQQDVVRGIGHDDVDGRDEGAGPRGVRVVEVVDPARRRHGIRPQPS